MAHDYTDLDLAIIARVVEGRAEFGAICGATWEPAKKLALSDPAPSWRIVDRRLQALRKAGRVSYQRSPPGWVLAASN